MTGGHGGFLPWFWRGDEELTKRRCCGIAGLSARIDTLIRHAERATSKAISSIAGGTSGPRAMTRPGEDFRTDSEMGMTQWT
jgi:hypothetical protein